MRGIYLLLLLGVVVTTLPLELVLHTRVYARWRRLVLTLLPVAAVFTGWDVLAVHAGHWSYDPRQTSGVLLPGRLPVEEVLFFLVVPTAAVLTYEAVRTRRPRWRYGDEDDE